MIKFIYGETPANIIVRVDHLYPACPVWFNELVTGDHGDILSAIKLPEEQKTKGLKLYLATQQLSRRMFVQETLDFLMGHCTATGSRLVLLDGYPVSFLKCIEKVIQEHNLYAEYAPTVTVEKVATLKEYENALIDYQGSPDLAYLDLTGATLKDALPEFVEYNEYFKKHQEAQRQQAKVTTPTTVTPGPANGGGLQ